MHWWHNAGEFIHPMMKWKQHDTHWPRCLLFGKCNLRESSMLSLSDWVKDITSIFRRVRPFMSCGLGENINHIVHVKQTKTVYRTKRSRDLSFGWKSFKKS